MRAPSRSLATPLRDDAAVRALERRRPTAPDDLASVEAFVNSIAFPGVPDQLGSPSELRAWLRAYGLLAEREAVTDSDVALAKEVRDALRALVQRNNGGEKPSSADLMVLSRAASRGNVAPSWASEDVAFVPQRWDVPGAIAKLLNVVALAKVMGSWPRLKGCRSAGCNGWAFYDHTKNRSAVWCTPDVCGNREHVRAHRARAHDRSKD
jgi:predicted RNA-binding Zn ribbon-like protein